MADAMVCERRLSQAIGDAHKINDVSADGNQNHESGFEEYLYEYSNERISFANDRFDYDDVITACIGHGSFGTVFKGFDHKSSKEVAIKKMYTVHVKPEELKTMQQVKNDHLVALIDICDEQKGVTHLVMELCDIDLDCHLREHAPHGNLTPSELILVMDNITRGYYALYERHIVHRDIKPQNILLVYHPYSHDIHQAKITDFGVSRMLTEDEQPMLNNVAGTLYYMAPEVGANLLTLSGYDHSADMWSIGCVFYQCLVGEMPFDERALCRIFLYCAGENYEAYDLPDIPENTPTEIHKLIASMLDINRATRANPVQLLAALKSLNSENDNTTPT
uniref:Protein kinase domain-containing protein n=1 Tax=Panagrellus redivivus TaxID=6233 RepID=A0A7E4W1R5_PANRE